MVNAGRIKDYSAELVKSAPDRFSCLSKWRPRVIRSFGPMSAIVQVSRTPAMTKPSTRSGPASEKRQGTKSRSAMQWRCGGALWGLGRGFLFEEV